MGCDTLVCMKCKKGYDLENGCVTQCFVFIKDHWHSRKKPSGFYFVGWNELGKHFHIFHNVPKEYKVED